MRCECVCLNDEDDKGRRREKRKSYLSSQVWVLGNWTLEPANGMFRQLKKRESVCEMVWAEISTKRIRKSQTINYYDFSLCLYEKFLILITKQRKRMIVFS